MPHLPTLHVLQPVTLRVLQPVTLHVLQPVTLHVLQPVIYIFCSSVEYKSFQSEVEPGRLPPTKPSKGMIIAPAPVPSAIHRSSSLPRATPGSSITHFIHPVNQTDTHSTFITKRFVDFLVAEIFSCCFDCMLYWSLELLTRVEQLSLFAIFSYIASDAIMLTIL